METARRVVRWNRINDRMQLEIISYAAVADDTLPIAISVRNNNFSPILGVLPDRRVHGGQQQLRHRRHRLLRAATRRRSSALTDATRRSTACRRLDPARSYVSGVQSFPINVEVRHVQTFDATTPPGDRTGRHRVARDAAVDDSAAERRRCVRASSISASATSRSHRVNYGLDELKAATRRSSRAGASSRRIRPRTRAARSSSRSSRSRTTSIRRRRHVAPLREGRRRAVADGLREGGLQERDRREGSADQGAGSRLGQDDARYSIVRWTASLVRNADGPEHARSAQRRDHQQRDHVVPQPHALVSQLADGRDRCGESRWRARSTCPKS